MFARRREPAAAMPAIQAPVVPFDTGHAYRGLAITTRILSCITVFQMVVILVLGLTIWSMQPLVRIEPYFLQVEPESKSVVRVQPMERDATLVDQLEIGWVRDYVRMREEVLPDAPLMTRRARPFDGWVARRSTDAVYAGYRQDNETFMRDAIRERVTRRVVLDDPVRLPAKGRLYQVDYVAIEQDPTNGERSRRLLRATLEVTYRPITVSDQEFHAADNEANPFGFTVVSYARTLRAAGG